jgi:predicted PurR-regulated permease PerM
MTINTSSLLQKMLLFILVIAGLYYMKVFLMPLAISGVLATLFLPFCKWLEGKKVPKGLATLLCLIILLIVLAGIGSLLVWQINALLQDFENIKQKTLAIVTFLQQYIFDHLGLSTEKQLKIFEGEQPSITNIVQLIAGSIAYIFTNFVLILAYIFCLLYYRSHLKKFILQMTPGSEQVEMEQVVYKSTHVSQQYLVGLTKMIVCLWIMYGIGFSLLGVKNALLFAILCGLFEIVPYIGNLTGTSLTVFVAAVHGAHLPMLFGIIGVYGIIQFVQGWLLEPIIVGPQVKINPFSTILALVSGELIWGIPGIFLAIPLLAMFKIVCDHIDPLKPFGYLIGEIVKKKKKPDQFKVI